MYPFCLPIDIRSRVHFTILFIHCSNEDMDREDTRHTLLESAFATNASGESLKEAIGTINHRFKVNHDETVCKNLLLLLVELLERALSNHIFQGYQLVRFVWHLPAVLNYASSSLHSVIRPSKRLLFRDWILLTCNTTLSICTSHRLLYL
jgi:hypothetical protein